MGGVFERVDPSFLALAFMAAVLGAWALGWRSGRRASLESGEDPGVRFTDAAFALLGLLLAFTFSMSLGKHDQRRAMVVAESNAIGDFYTCASLLPSPARSRLQGLIHEYAQRKLEVAIHLTSEADLQESSRWFQDSHSRMTAVVAEALAEETPVAIPLTQTLNGVTSAHASRLAAFRDRLPWSIALVLFLSAVVPSFLMGLQQARSARPQLTGTISFIFMATLVIYITLDLNQPGHGTITVSQEPFERLLQSMGK